MDKCWYHREQPDTSQQRDRLKVEKGIKGHLGFPGPGASPIRFVSKVCGAVGSVKSSDAAYLFDQSPKAGLFVRPISENLFDLYR